MGTTWHDMLGAPDTWGFATLWKEELILRGQINCADLVGIPDFQTMLYLDRMDVISKMLKKNPNIEWRQMPEELFPGRLNPPEPTNWAALMLYLGGILLQ